MLESQCFGLHLKFGQLNTTLRFSNVMHYMTPLVVIFLKIDVVDRGVVGNTTSLGIGNGE